MKASEAAEAEQINTPVDSDGEVQIFNKQSSTTQIETFLLFVFPFNMNWEP